MHRGCNIPHGGCNIPHGGCNIPHRGCNSPHIGCNSTNFDCNSPHSVCNIPHRGCNRLHIGCSIPHGACNSPHRGCNSSHAGTIKPPFEPTVTAEEKMAKPFLFERGFTPSDPHKLLKQPFEKPDTLFSLFHFFSFLNQENCFGNWINLFSRFLLFYIFVFS